MRFFALLSLLLAVVVVWPAADCYSQCAMCKATLEANAANQNKYGLGLNTGILYLMTIPYIAAAVVGYLWYKNARLKKSPSRPSATA